jgi:hypothetical protein
VNRITDDSIAQLISVHCWVSGCRFVCLRVFGLFGVQGARLFDTTKQNHRQNQTVKIMLASLPCFSTTCFSIQRSRFASDSSLPIVWRGSGGGVSGVRTRAESG